MTEEQARRHAEALAISMGIPSTSCVTLKATSPRCKLRRMTATIDPPRDVHDHKFE